MDLSKDVPAAEHSLSKTLAVLLVCFAIVTLDGYDLLCMSFAAQPMAHDMAVDVSRFGPVFGAGAAGVLVGGLTIGAMSDRFGRKRILLLSVLLFGLSSLMPVLDVSFDRLMIYRFITGLGLGGTLPCTAAIVAETSPRHLRRQLVGIMYGGVAVGGILGGIAAASLLPTYGWSAIFWVGGLLPLAMVPLILVILPETTGIDQPVNADPALRRLKNLFGQGRSMPTLLLWLAAFCAYLSFGTIISWLPVFMTNYGLSTQTGIFGPVALNLGGIIGTGLIGLLFAQFGMARTISACFLFAALGMVAIALLLGPQSAALPAILLTGFFLLGGNNSNNSLITNYYPPAIRGTAIGWALGMGRVGFMVGPVAAGLMLGANVPSSAILTSLAFVLLIASAAVLLFDLRIGRGEKSDGAQL